MIELFRGMIIIMIVIGLVSAVLWFVMYVILPVIAGITLIGLAVLGYRALQGS